MRVSHVQKANNRECRKGDTPEVWGQLTLCGGELTVRCQMFLAIPVLYPLDASSAVSPDFEVDPDTAKWLLGGQNQGLDEKLCFWKVPPAVTIVFVCFSMFYQGRLSVSFPTPNTHERERAGTCLFRHRECAWSWGRLPHWMDATNSVPQEV